MQQFMKRRREVVFGCPGGGYLDRNAKAAIVAMAKGWSQRQRRKGQHRGPLTRAYEEVLKALLFKFNQNAKGLVYPTIDKIAAASNCCTDTVVGALAVLEQSGVLTWFNRIVRRRHEIQDLFGQWKTVWKVCRTSNAYVFVNPMPRVQPDLPDLPLFSYNTENPVRNTNKDSILNCAVRPKYKLDPDNPVDAALSSLFGSLRATSVA